MERRSLSPGRAAAKAPALIEGEKGTVTMTFKDGKKKAVPLNIDTNAGGEKAVYFCPMHSEVVQMEPGICSLCGGMKLFTQDRLFAKVDLSKVEPGTSSAPVSSTRYAAGAESTKINAAVALMAPRDRRCSWFSHRAASTASAGYAGST